jgi:hypothetical protein
VQDLDGHLPPAVILAEVDRSLPAVPQAVQEAVARDLAQLAMVQLA